jgi:15-cis-phytoene synthase
VPSLLLMRPAARRPSGRGGLTLAVRALPRALHADVRALYGVFRVLDDLVDDGAPEAAARVAAVAAWADGGRPRSPEAETLGVLDARREVPREAMIHFCRGMEHDLARRPIATEADLDLYCRRVAGSVALVVTAWLGERRPSRDAAVALGIALQRTNVLRDVDEDAARGRTYLPAETLERFGPPAPGRRTALWRFATAQADAWYDRGIPGIGDLARGRTAIAVAAATYREILREIERGRYDLRAGRAVVPAHRRVAVAAAAAAGVAP